MTPLRKIKIWRWSLTSRCVMARTTPIQSVGVIKQLETKFETKVNIIFGDISFKQKNPRFTLSNRKSQWFD